MSKKSFDKRNLSALNSFSYEQIDTGDSSKNNERPLTVAVYIEKNRLENDLANQTSLRTINYVDCDTISIIDETESSSNIFSSNLSITDIESSSTVISSNSSIIDVSNQYKWNGVDTHFGQSSGLSPPSNFTVNIKSMENGQQVYNGPVIINQFITDNSDKNHGNWKWMKKATSGKIVTYLVILLLISIIIILINNISSLIPTPQILRQNTADQSESLSSADKKGFENSTINAYDNHADLVKVDWNCKTENFFATYATTIVLLLIANFLIFFFMKRCKKFGSDDCGDTYSDAIVSDTSTIHVVSRTEWLAKPPKEKLTPLVLPSTTVIIAHTDTNRGSTKEMLSLQIRHIQLKHMVERGWDDIGYNFLVGDDGAIYVGRGWNQQGAHSRGYNAKSICIAFIGRFNVTEPPECQLIAAQKLIEEGVKLNKLTKDYRLYGHRQLRPFDSPGLVLYRIIQKWEHWTEDVVAP